jgi:hypothetical protein
MRSNRVVLRRAIEFVGQIAVYLAASYRLTAALMVASRTRSRNAPASASSSAKRYSTARNRTRKDDNCASPGLFCAALQQTCESWGNGNCTAEMCLRISQQETRSWARPAQTQTDRERHEQLTSRLVEGTATAIVVDGQKYVFQILGFYVSSASSFKSKNKTQRAFVCCNRIQRTPPADPEARRSKGSDRTRCGARDIGCSKTENAQITVYSHSSDDGDSIDVESATRASGRSGVIVK